MEDVQVTVSEVVEFIFSHSPKETCCYKLYFWGETVFNHVKMFPILMQILICGAKMLYGNDILPQNMTMEQFDTLKKYMSSIGFVVKHNYTYAEDTDTPLFVNIWFEPLVQLTDCHGHTFIKKLKPN
jgi:hypothetical protein